MIHPDIFLFFKIALALWSLVVSDIPLFSPSKSDKNVVEILIRFTMKLHNTFGNMGILMILILLIQQHGEFLHF